MVPRKSSQPLLSETEAPIRSRPRKKRDPAQSQLLLDPVPARIEPCLALLLVFVVQSYPLEETIFLASPTASPPPGGGRSTIPLYVSVASLT
ncbi:hypothetical protein ABID08_002041 [Rhizobium binae]|uniref:Uncharacterized protein n=1 Tax=Rhizobium binae TaxID=1138190 RepID=A0ABV2MEX5_9HYPH